MKKTGKRGFALLLAVLLCLPLGLESVSAADDTPLAGVDGVVDIWKWTRVRNQSDLPNTRPTRTVGSRTETYDYALLLVYEHDGKNYIANFAPENRRTNSGVAMKDCFWLPAAPIPDNIDLSLNTFRTLENPGHVFLRPTGEQDTDNNCKIYELYAEDRSDPVCLNFGALPDDWTGTVQCGFSFSDSRITYKYPGISFCSSDARSGCVSSNMFKLFHNISGITADYCLTTNSDGSVLCQRPGTWSMTEFQVYIGVKEQWSAIRSDYTIRNGMVANYNGYIYLEPNVTVTVEEGGVLSVSGTLYNNGTIQNNGGTVLVQQDSSIEQFCLGDPRGGTLRCDGGDLVILSGGRVTTYSLDMYHGATCTNFGVLVNASLFTQFETGAAIDNRVSGTIFLGVEPKNAYSGNLSSLPRAAAAAPSTYQIKHASYRGNIYVPKQIVVGDDVLLYNEGTIYSAVHMIRAQANYDAGGGKWRQARNITCKGNGKLYVYPFIDMSNTVLGYQNCLSEWSSMCELYRGT